MNRFHHYFLLIFRLFHFGKVSVCAVLLVLNSSFLTSQQLPVLNQSLYNPYLFNPAYAGKAAYTQIYLNIRDQWREMPESPFFCSLSADGRLRNENSGLGFQLQTDRQPIIQNITSFVTYRHLVKLNKDHSLRMALSGGLFLNSINLSHIDAESPTETTLMEKSNSKAAFDANAGIIYGFKKFELGVAALQLINSDFRYHNRATDHGFTYRLIRCFTANASYRFDAGKDWNITPSAILYSTQGMPVYAMTSCKLDYLGDYSLAVGYRSDRSIAVSCAMVISGAFTLGYSFETPVNKYGASLGNTHEITLGIRLFGRSGAPASRNDVSRKEVEQLADIIRMQSLQIDELAAETEKLRNDAEKQQQRYDSKQAELEALIARVAEQTVSQRQETEKLIEESPSPTELSEQAPLEPESGRYAVIVGAYVRLEDAKLYQKMLERDLNVVSWVFERQSGQVRYLVYSKIIQTRQEAQTEFDRLNGLGIEKFKQGRLWLYRFQ